MASAGQFAIIFTISLGKSFLAIDRNTIKSFISVVLAVNCAPTNSELSDAIELQMNTDELQSNHHHHQLADASGHMASINSVPVGKRDYMTEGILLGKRNYHTEGILLGKRDYPTEGILLGKRQYPTEGIMIGKREYPTEGIMIGKREYPTEGIMIGKREYPTEGIMIGKREYPTEGILLGKRNFRFFAPKSSASIRH